MNIQTVIFNKVSFVNVINPHELEIKDLKNNFGFNPLHIEDYIHKTQTPKIESSKNYYLIVLDIPSFNNENGVQNTTNGDRKTSKSPINSLLSLSHATLSSMPIPHFLPHEKKMRVISNQVALFIGKDYVVVLHSGITPINHIFSLCQKTLHNRNEFISQGPVYLTYRIIDALIDICFPVINKISGMIDHIDKELERAHSQNTLEDISVTRRNIVVFHTMIKPIIPLFQELKSGKYEKLNGNMQQYWGDILNHLQKIWDRLEDSRELIEGISESNESLLSSKTNQIIRVLTIFSAIMLPLNLIASIYGMNINGLPFSQDQNPFIAILLIMLIIGGTMLFIFKIKRWF